MPDFRFEQNKIYNQEGLEKCISSTEKSPYCGSLPVFQYRMTIKDAIAASVLSLVLSLSTAVMSETFL